ncbi:MAG: D-2-hydroxyacid dehydrogenase [Phycisphaerae bacterium]
MNILLLYDLGEQADNEIRKLLPDARVVRSQHDDPDRQNKIADAEMICGWPGVDQLAAADKLRWLHLPSAGATRYARALPESVLLTNSSGTMGTAMADHVFAMILAMARDVPAMVKGQLARSWRTPARNRFELTGQTMGIVGLGDIGLQTARRAKGFDMRVIANKRTPGQKPDCVDQLLGPDGLGRILAESDHIVVTLPGTKHTDGLISRELIEQIKPEAYIYNVGRGSTIDQPAMIDALQSGRLAGAGLDVFDPEPLPADSPLWTMDNVLISPHCAGSTPHHRSRCAELFLANLRHLIAGEELTNLVDRDLEY